MTAAELLIAHAPRLRYHPRERFRATSVESMVGPTSRTELLRANGEAIASTDPERGLLPLSLDTLQPFDSDYAGIEGVRVRRDDYLSGRLPADASFTGTPLAYARAVPVEDAFWLQYWLFSYDNPHHVVGDHQGDWELVQLKVDPARSAEERVLAATCFQHGEPEGREGRDLEPFLDGGALCATVALGSHASYFDDETMHLGDQIDLDAPAVACDTTPLEDAAGWMLWPGYWGGSRFMGRPRSPRGPQMCRSEWSNPEDRHAEGMVRRRRRGEERKCSTAAFSKAFEPPREVTLVAQAGPGAAVEEVEASLAPLGLPPAAVEPLQGAPGGAKQFAVTVALPPSEAGAPPSALAFDLAREVRAAATDWEVEPDLPSTLFRPSPDSYGVCEMLGKESAHPRWAVNAIRCPEAWTRSRGEGIKIGHPDTGFVAHPELERGAIGEGGYDLFEDDPDPTDCLAGIPPVYFPGHGTGTASVIASRGGGPDEFCGAAPACTVVPFRVARTVVLFGGARRLVRAIRLARERDCGVISISLGGLVFGSSLRREIEAAVAEGRIVVAAAGQPTPFVVEPASYESTIGVAGTTVEGKVWSLSARGKSVDISAPAAAVNRAVARTGGVGRGDGTSFSTALVAGVAALWLSAHREELAKEPASVQAKFRSLLVQSASRPPGWDGDERRFGAGIVDAGALLDLPLDAAKPLEAAPEPSRGKRIIAWLSRLVEAPIEPWLDATFRGRPEEAAERYGTELAYLAGADDGARRELKAAAELTPVPTADGPVLPPPLPPRVVARGSASLSGAMAQPA